MKIPFQSRISIHFAILISALSSVNIRVSGCTSDTSWVSTAGFTCADVDLCVESFDGQQISCPDPLDQEVTLCNDLLNITNDSGRITAIDACCVSVCDNDQFWEGTASPEPTPYYATSQYPVSDAPVSDAPVSQPPTNTMKPSISAVPSSVPSVSAQPTSTNAPSIECPCTDCYHTATCNPDPHYLSWDNTYYDFQGGCDQIAVDNPVLEIQIRTRPRNYYSAITQIAIRFKQTNEIFHVEAGVGVITNTLTAASRVTYGSSNPYSPWYLNFVQHNISFMGLINSYIVINEELWDRGLSIQIRGHGSIFCGSEGMFGSWNYGSVRFPDGTPYDTSGGYAATAASSITLAQAWKIGAHPGTTNLLNNPSTVCDASPSCGNPGDAFSCTSTRRVRNLRELQGSCGTTDCSFIDNDIVRGACEQDLALSGGDTKWTCQRAYTDPVFEEADPCDFFGGDCPSSAPSPAPPCNDSPLLMRTMHPNGKRVVTGFCRRLRNFRREQRCRNVPGASEACPETCESCEVCADPNADVHFLVNNDIGWQNCEWVALDTAARCPLVQNLCRATCEVC